MAAVALAAASFLVRIRWPFMVTRCSTCVSRSGRASVLFTLGTVLGERGAVQRLPETWTRSAGWIAGGGVLGLFVLGGLHLAVIGDLDPMLGGWHWASAVLALIEAITAIAGSVWVVDHVGRSWPARGRVLGRAGRGAYGAYVLHPLVLVLLSRAARPLPWPPEAKFVLFGVVGVLASCVLAGP